MIREPGRYCRRPRRFLALVCLAGVFAATVLPADAKVRVRAFNNQLEIEVSHVNGIRSYIVKRNNRNGAVEANPVFTNCPNTDTTVLPAAHTQHAHWILLVTCKDEQFIYQANVNTSTWTEVTEEPYTPPSEDDEDEEEHARSAGLIPIITMGAAVVAAIASVIALLVLLGGRRAD